MRFLLFQENRNVVFEQFQTNCSTFALKQQILIQSYRIYTSLRAVYNVSFIATIVVEVKCLANVCKIILAHLDMDESMEIIVGLYYYSL